MATHKTKPFTTIFDFQTGLHGAGWYLRLFTGNRRPRGGRSTGGALLEAKARDDGQNLGRAHLGLTTTGRGHFRFGEFLRADALLQGVKDYLKIWGRSEFRLSRQWPGRCY